ncbi:MAG: sulfurtransferase [Anaerolineales bacterium]|jgi:thiosulfate/3-mercaptopyruvate sulfurtransferase
MNYKTLVTAGELFEHLDDPAWVIIDCRFWLNDTEKGRRDYLDKLIPGAFYAHLDEHLSGEVIPGLTGRHPLPQVDEFVERLSSWGIGDGVQVVGYDDRGGAISARLWWMLRWFGHESVALLNGGWQRWVAEGYPTSDVIPESQPRLFTAQLQPELMVTTEQVESLLEDDNYLLVDSRTEERYRGEEEPIDPVAGHIPSAVSAPYPGNLDENGYFLPRKELRKRFRSLLGDVPEDRTIFYCGSGVTSIHNLIAMVHAGLEEGRLYVGSWSEWINDPERPIATVEQ